MAILVRRSLIKTRGSRMLTLPPAWCRYYGHRVDHVTVMGTTCLVIAPQGLEDEAKKMIKAIENDSKDREGTNRE
jgi:hypothetical protein